MPPTNSDRPILVTGAAGQVGSVGFKIVKALRSQGQPVRAMVRQIDARSAALQALGAEVVKGDLTVLADVHRVLTGCRRLYFGMSVSGNYLEATLNAAAVAKHHEVEAFVNISQMTVSEMSVHATTESQQQKFHWLSEQALNWSGLPVVHLRATVFLEHFFFNAWAAQSINQSGKIRAPFGKARTSPIATYDVARVAATILANPLAHLGKTYELTGPKSEDMATIAAAYSRALNRSIEYEDMPFDEWETTELEAKALPPHVRNHVRTMAWLHHANRYDRASADVQRITGTAPMGVEAWVHGNALFAPNAALA